jgi:lysophospholipase L1-like esterase
MTRFECMALPLNLLLAAFLAFSHPPQWAKRWIAAFRASGKTAVHVVVLSDSTAHVDQTNGVGYGPDKRANLWPFQLQSDLARFSPGQSAGTGLLTLEANAGRLDTDVWSLTGPYRYKAEIGPFQPRIGAVPENGGTVVLAPHSEARLTSQSGDTLWIYWASCPDSAAFAVTVDQAPPITLQTKPSTHCIAMRSHAFTGELGAHAVTIRAGAGNAYLYAAEWTREHAGIAVDNLAVGGATTTFFNSADKLAYVHTIPNVGLVIVALGINDFAHNVTLQSYEGSLSAIIEDLQWHSPQASLLVIGQYGVLSDDMHNSLGLTQAQYNEMAQQVAAQYKVGYFDFASVWPSFSAVQNNGMLTSDKVHPSDAGGRVLARRIEDVIIKSTGLGAIQ